MSVDRPDVDAPERADYGQPVARPSDLVADTPEVRRPTEVRGSADIGERTTFRVPTAEERVEAHQQARQTADTAYAAWNRRAEDHAGAATEVDESRQQGPPAATPTVRSSDRAGDSQTSQSLDKPSAAEEALRARVTELEADKASRDRQFVAQDAKLAAQAKTVDDQGERIERLEAYVGRITTAVSELRQTQDEIRPSAEIAERAGGTQAERAKPQHKRRLPTDAWNTVISAAAGGSLTELAFHVRDLSPENAGLAASALTVGTGLVAAWRERRKAKDDDDRPKG
jgi:chromosome segregation ATPase